MKECAQQTELLLLDPYREYRHFLECCKLKPKNSALVYHNHHIIPRHMDSPSWNETLSLSVQDHAQAHILLSKCFSEGSYERIANLKSAAVLNSKSIKDQSILDCLSKSKKGMKNHFYGKRHTKETKAKLSASTKAIRTGVNYTTLYGTNSDNQKSKRANSIKEVWNRRSKEQRRLIAQRGSAKRKGKSSWNKNFGALLEINGHVFQSWRQAQEFFHMSKFLLKKNFSINIIESNRTRSKQ